MPFIAKVVSSLFLLAVATQVAAVTSVQQRQVRDVAIGASGFTERARKSKSSGVTLDFGGSHHGTDSSNDEMRPEAVKSQVCDDASNCQECTNQASCWRGYSTGKLKLDVPKGSAVPNRYVAEMWARCDDGNGDWAVYLWGNGLVNGYLNIFVDGKLFGKYTNSRKGRNIKVPISKNTHVRCEFVRTKSGAAASGYISLSAYGVDAYVDDCMGVKECLVGLGDGTANAFSFRNSNKKQLQCLRASTTNARKAVSDHCDPWNTCLSQQPGRKDQLKVFLAVAVETGALLAEDGAVAGQLADTPGCINPEVEDAESWDCECMEEMKASCGGLNEECFREKLCGNSNICDSWKGDHCPSSSLLATHRANMSTSQGQTAALVRRTTAMGSAGSKIGDSIDSALSGKCAE